jgi:hypothetical protein
MDAAVPYTTLEPKWQLVRGHVRTGDLASHTIVPTAKSARSTAASSLGCRTAEPAESHVLRHVAGPMKKTSPHYDGES